MLEYHRMDYGDGFMVIPWLVMGASCSFIVALHLHQWMMV